MAATTFPVRGVRASLLQPVKNRSIEVRYGAVYGIAWWSVADVLVYGMVLYGTVWYGMVGMVWYGMV